MHPVALEAVRPGWKLYSKTRFYDDGLQPVGGTLVNILPAGVDGDTGEMYPARYRCLNTWHPAHWPTLTADEIDTDQLAGLDRRAAEAGTLFLLKPLFVGRRVARLHGLKDVEAIHDAWRLAAAWAGIR
ncbi:MAG TPA: hypothetical protein VGH66_02860 [Acidimicrobiales bacterium]|jgi:hypothetical protein